MSHWLVTGATGFLGSVFVREALRREEGLQLTCLARSAGGRAARDRILDAIVKAAADGGEGDLDSVRASVTARVLVLDCDLDQTALLPFDAIADVTQIWHFAARLGFRAGLARKLFRTNVDGTRGLLEETRRWSAAPFNYVSTAYVAGKRSGPIEEGPFDPSFPVNNPYEESKRAGEELVRAEGKTGRPVRIFRPSIVVHHSVTFRGSSSAGVFGFVSVAHALREELEGKLPGLVARVPITLHTTAEPALNLICVDDVAADMLALSADPRTLGGIWHVTADEDTPFPTLAALIGAGLGVRLLATNRREELSPVDEIVRREAVEFTAYLSSRPRFSKAPVAPGEPRRRVLVDRDAAIEMVRIYASTLDEEAARRSRGTRSILSSMTAKRLSAGGRSFPYYVGGDGPHPVLILNAYGQSLHFWSRLADQLRPRCRMIMWEMRGTSAGADAGEPLSVEEHARDALAILDAEGLDGAHVLGWCTGGKLGLVLDALAPGRVRSLCFLTPSFNAWPGLPDLKTPYESDMEPICRMVDQRPQAAVTVRQALKAALVGDPPVLDSVEGERVANVLKLVDRGLRTLVVAPFVETSHVVGYARQLLAFWAHDVRSLVARCQKPTLVIVGADDGIASPLLAARVAAALPNGRCVKVMGAGHYPHFENAATLAPLILSYVERGLDIELDDGRLSPWTAESAPLDAPHAMNAAGRAVEAS